MILLHLLQHSLDNTLLQTRQHLHLHLHHLFGVQHLFVLLLWLYLVFVLELKHWRDILKFFFLFFIDYGLIYLNYYHLNDLVTLLLLPLLLPVLLLLLLHTVLQILILVVRARD